LGRVSTKRDLDHQSALLRGEMQAGFADLRGEMQAGFADLRGEMQARFADLRGEVSAVEVRFERALRETSRTFFLGMLTANASLAALAFAAAQLT
jgi:hypothetical protein